MKFYKTIIRAFSDFFKDNGMLLAGSISYFSMMAIIPLCLLIISIFSYFLGEHNELLKFFSQRLVSFFPQVTQEITDELKKLISYRTIGHFTLAIYTFLSYQLFLSLELSINKIFKTEVKRHPLTSIILSLLTITLVLLSIILSFGATSFIAIINSLQSIIPELKIGRLTSFILGYLIPLILVFFILTTLYFFLPQKSVKLKNAIWGAAFSALLLEVAKHLFTLYVKKILNLGTIYGSLSAFIIFLLWVYYSSCIFLIGGEIVHNLAKKK
jgi:membrane protein